MTDAASRAPDRPSPTVAAADERIAFVFQSFLAYHHDRMTPFGDRAIPVALAATSADYASFQRQESTPDAAPRTALTTLFPGRRYEDLSLFERIWRTPGALARLGARRYFLCNYNTPEMFLSAIYLRLRGRRVFVMAVSRFVDRPRRPLVEIVKSAMFAPYCGALVGGSDAAAYLRFLGFRRRPIAMGYNVVSLDRVRRQAAQAAPAADAAPIGAFLFVGRMVEKKQPQFLIEAYAAYVERTTAPIRRLRMIGDGPELEPCRARIASLGLTTVDLLGASPSADVAAELSRARALLAPSRYEEWGLVLNEALAFGSPIVASETMGGAAVLVETLGNGVKLAPDDRRGWTEAILQLAEDDALAARYAARAAEIAPRADVLRFREGVEELLAACDGS